MQPLELTRRHASEKVLDYIKTLSQQATGGKPTRLPSVRRLAKHLDVSPSTVASVYRQIKAEGRLQSTQGSGSFLTPDPQALIPVNHIRVITNLPYDVQYVPDPWYAQIMGSITMAAVGAKVQLTIQNFDSVRDEYRPIPAHDVALVVPAHEGRAELIRWAEKRGIAQVFLNPPTDNATENFVSSDYFGSCERLGRAFLEQGRKRILVIVNLPYSHGASNRLRISGLLAGLEYGSQNGVSVEMIFTDYQITMEAGRDAVLEYEKKHGCLPDAIFTPGDLLAVGCYTELTNRGVKCPEEAAVVGGTGLILDHTPCPQITRGIHPFKELGEAFIRVLTECATSPQTIFPGKIIPMKWIGGATTTPLENQLLFGM